mgnify:CR=1 FL=1|tara:strand:+ start:2707 stop:2937 length:231 start_codon:yes stop_codon:yes gene_type:complete
MSFMSKPDEVSNKESILFTHWMTIIQLLKIGVPWDAIQKLSSQEVNMILGVEMAILQKQQEEQVRAQAQQRSSFKI